MAEEVDIEVDLRRRILQLYRALDRTDHYRLLGVDRAADKKTIKRAYFDLAAKLHPDKYFRKRLGSFKARMEAVFGRITLAQDTLTNADKRAEYDAYVEEQRRSRGIEELLADAMAEVKRAEETAEREARAAESNPSQPAMKAPAASGPPEAPKPSTIEVSAAARRDALARRLLGGNRPASRPSQPPVQRSPSIPSTADAMDALRRRYEDRKSQARAAQARKYLAAGEEALAKNDAVSAANAFRVAASLLPQDEEIQKRSAETQSRADAMLADTYAKQAIYEEKMGQWAEASRSWQRVCKGRPKDAKAHDRAANAIVKAGGDSHEAARLAQQAIALAPDHTAFRVTLANVYLAAGLALNARRELETAAQRAPHDDTIQAMLKRVAKA
ncbi:MAG TPA: DnaJ domain-containing protein [Polyangiaceae bacterium]|nr:DnaJ domain-containing protein [Polyangiaceae bacterium]